MGALDQAIRTAERADEFGRQFDGWASPPDIPGPPDLVEFMDVDYPPSEQIIGPISSQQLILGSAQTGVGKTQFAVAITMALRNGAPWLHWPVPKPRGVLFLDGEMAGSDLQARFKLYQDKNYAPLKVVNAINWADTLGLGHPNLANLKWQAVIEQWAAGLDVIVVDNIMSLAEVAGESLSADQFWRPLYSWGLRQRAAGRTVIYLDHANSAGNVFGTKTKTWNTDLCFTLETPKDHDPASGCCFTLRFTKTRGMHGQLVAPFEAKLITDAHNHAMWSRRWLDEALMEEALELSKSGRTQREIKAELGLSLAKVNRLLQQARKAGLP